MEILLLRVVRYPGFRPNRYTLDYSNNEASVNRLAIVAVISLSSITRSLKKTIDVKVL